MGVLRGKTVQKRFLKEKANTLQYILHECIFHIEESHQKQLSMSYKVLSCAEACKTSYTE